jgi:hydroxymethylglutaryl-CoA lyase
VFPAKVWIREAGLQKIEVTSFVSPKAVGQLKDAEAVVKLLDTKGQVEFSGLVMNEKGMERAVAVAFGCPFEGEVPVAALDRVVTAMCDTGISQITLADTAGLASPVQVRGIISTLQKKYCDVLWGLHFHDTRGLGLANVYAGLEEGVSIFESSTGGLGGCPFIPNAAGNVATEDLVNMLHMMGIDTGIDLTKLIGVAGELEDMLGRPLSSRMLRLQVLE